MVHFARQKYILSTQAPIRKPLTQNPSNVRLGTVQKRSVDVADPCCQGQVYRTRRVFRQKPNESRIVRVRSCLGAQRCGAKSEKGHSYAVG